MTTPTPQGRLLAIAAGAAFTAGGLTILLGADLMTPLAWASYQWLTILTVFGTIAAGHLMVDAARARHVFAMLGFLTLFLSGTALVVYSSVGRQAEAAGTTLLSVEDTNARILDKREDLAKARARLDEATKYGDAEMVGQRCGPRCKDWRQRAKEVQALVTQLDAEIAALGPQKPVNAQAAAFADFMALFGFNAAKVIGAAIIISPFLKTLFFEIGSIVSIGFAFRSRPVAKTAGTGVTPPATISTPVSGEATFSAAKATALANVTPDAPLVAMFSGDLPEPPAPRGPNGPRGPSGGRKSRRQPLPANVVAFAKHPVVAALEGNGGSVASNRELARLMAVSDGEASKRWQEIEPRLRLERRGKELRIALK